jgi:hypothetical protein
MPTAVTHDAREYGSSNYGNNDMTPSRYREWFRTIDFFQGPGGWYFLSPDRLAMGPYPLENIAEAEAAHLAKFLKSHDDKRIRRAVVEFSIAAFPRVCAATEHVERTRTPATRASP